MSSKNQVRVGMIEPVGGHGGMDYYDFGLCEGLRLTNIDIALFTCDETDKGSEKRIRSYLTYRNIYGEGPIWLRGLRYLRGSIHSIYICIREKKRIVHFHWFHVGVFEFFNICLARLLRRKVVVTAHDIEALADVVSLSFLIRPAYRMAHAIIVHNNFSKHELCHKVGLHEKIIHIIPHGNYLHAVDCVPDKKEARRKLGLPANGKILLFFGQIKDVKGLDVLLRAMPQILKRHTDTDLLIAGRVWKSDFGRYQKEMDYLNINEHCILHIHYIQNKDVSSYFAAADIVVLPYLKIYQSGVLLMAMSHGKCVIASDLDGMKDVISDGINGVLFESGNHLKLSDSIINLFNDKKQADIMGNNALNTMEKTYSWERIGKLTKGVYVGL